jgi:endonuclease-3
MPSPRPKTNRWRQVLKRLERQHGRPERRDAPSPLEALILGLLKAETSERVAERALRRLTAEFLDFNEVRVTRPREIADAIQSVADPLEKATRIVRVLSALFQQRGTMDLDFLRRLPAVQARAFLESLDGVDARAVATVMQSLGAPAIPADAAVVRLAKRLGLADRAASADQVQQALERLVPAADKSTFHALLVRHGEAVCQVRTTRCRACGLVTLCVNGPPSASGRAARPTAAKAGPVARTSPTRPVRRPAARIPRARGVRNRERNRPRR